MARGLGLADKAEDISLLRLDEENLPVLPLLARSSLHVMVSAVGRPASEYLKGAHPPPSHHLFFVLSTPLLIIDFHSRLSTPLPATSLNSDLPSSCIALAEVNMALFLDTWVDLGFPEAVGEVLEAQDPAVIGRTDKSRDETLLPCESPLFSCPCSIGCS